MASGLCVLMAKQLNSVAAQRGFHKAISSPRLIVKSCFAIPLLDEKLDMLVSAKVFSKIELRSGYHYVGDEYKLAFRMRNGCISG